MRWRFGFSWLSPAMSDFFSGKSGRVFGESLGDFFWGGAENSQHGKIAIKKKNMFSKKSVGKIL